MVNMSSMPQMPGGGPEGGGGPGGGVGPGDELGLTPPIDLNHMGVPSELLRNT